MTAKATQPYTGAEHPPWWTVTDEFFTPKGQLVRRGDQLTITGERGKVFVFVNHTVAPPRPGSGKRKTVEWITALNDSGYHSFRPERIGKVFRPVKPTPRKRSR